MQVLPAGLLDVGHNEYERPHGAITSSSSNRASVSTRVFGFFGLAPAARVFEAGAGPACNAAFCFILPVRRRDRARARETARQLAHYCCPIPCLCPALPAAGLSLTDGPVVPLDPLGATVHTPYAGCRHPDSVATRCRVGVSRPRQRTAPSSCTAVQDVS